MNQLYYKGSLLNDEDISDISREFKISYALAAEAVDQLRKKGSIMLAQYAGTPRERLRMLSEAVSTTPNVDEDAGGDAPEAPEQLPAETMNEEEPLIVPENPEDVTTVEETDPEPKTEVDEIVSHAATSLMTAFTDPKGCFLITEDGCCAINPENPPTVEQGLVAVQHILKLKELGAIVDDKSSWMLGSSVVALENHHGENVFCISQICDETTKAYNTIYQATSVFKAFPKRYKLPYSTHQEVFFKKIPDEAKKLVLHKSEVYGLGSKQARELCSIIQRFDGDTTTVQNIRSKQQAEALIAAHKDSKVSYIVYDDGEMRKVNGSAGEQPEGKLVINLKDWTFSVNGEKPVDFVK